MADEKPQSRPEPAHPASPSVYGGQWGKSGKQSEADRGEEDRPEPIETPDEPQGTGGGG